MNTVVDDLTFEVVNQGLQTVYELLQAFAQRDDFLEQIRLAFGSSFDAEKLGELRQQWAAGKFEVFPEIEVRTGAELKGANGAFAAATSTIYLSRDYLERNGANLPAVTNVLLEEYGHFVDARINEVDAAGDEGAIFAAVVKDETFNETQLQRLKAEDDVANLTIASKPLSVEQQNGTVTGQLLALAPEQTYQLATRILGFAGDLIRVDLKQALEPNLRGEIRNFRLRVESEPFKYAGGKIATYPTGQNAGQIISDGGNFENTGIFYFIPEIPYSHPNNLNLGSFLSTIGQFDIDFTNNHIETGQFRIDVVPGHSTLVLENSVGEGTSTNTALDLYRVQQRLKYLGFPASNGHSIDVDGNFGDDTVPITNINPSDTAQSIRLFQATTLSTGTGNPLLNPPDGIVSRNGGTIQWINAINSPQWQELIDPDPQSQQQIQNNKTTFDFLNNVSGNFEIYPLRNPTNPYVNERTGRTPQNERFGASWTVKKIEQATAVANHATQVITAVSENGYTGSNIHGEHKAGLDIDVRIDQNLLQQGIGAIINPTSTQQNAPDFNPREYYLSQLSDSERDLAEEILAFYDAADGGTPSSQFMYVYVGETQNDYSRIRQVLNQLMVSAPGTASDKTDNQTTAARYKTDHNHHYHVSLKPPSILALSSPIDVAGNDLANAFSANPINKPLNSTPATNSQRILSFNDYVGAIAPSDWRTNVVKHYTDQTNPPPNIWWNQSNLYEMVTLTKQSDGRRTYLAPGTTNEVTIIDSTGNLVDNYSSTWKKGWDDRDDYYRFRIDKDNTTVYLTLDGLSADANLELINPANGSQITFPQTGTQSEFFSATLQSGDYYLHVFPVSSVPESSVSTYYNLTIQAGQGATGFGSNDTLYYRFNLLDSGSTHIDGQFRPTQSFRAALPANNDFEVSFYQPLTNRSGIYKGRTDANGNANLGNIILDQFSGLDTDFDGIPDVGEFVLGTNPRNSDNPFDSASLINRLKSGLEALKNAGDKVKSLLDGITNGFSGFLPQLQSNLDNNAYNQEYPVLGNLNNLNSSSSVSGLAKASTQITAFSGLASELKFVKNFQDALLGKLDRLIDDTFEPILQVLEKNIQDVIDIPEPTSPEFADFISKLPTLIDNLFSQLQQQNIDPKSAVKTALQNTFGTIHTDVSDLDVKIDNFLIGLNIELTKQLEGVLKSTLGPVQKGIFDVVGPSGLNILKDANDNNQIELNDVQVKNITGTDNFEFDLLLGTEKVLSAPISKNIGIPALGFNVNGEAKVDFSFDWDLGFGINPTDKFYLKTASAEPTGTQGTQIPELKIGLEATLPGFNVDGNLGFLSAEIRDAQTNPTKLAASISVDLQDKGSGNTSDGKWVVGESLEIGKPLPKISGDLNLDLKAGFDNNPEDDAISPYTVHLEFPKDVLNIDPVDLELPTIEAGLRLHWDTTSGFDSKHSGFKNVDLNLGQSISHTVGPIVSQVKPILEPIQQVTGILTKPIPFLEDLKLQSLLDVYPGPNGDNRITLIDLGLGLVTDQEKREKFTKLADVIVTVNNISNFITQLDVGSADNDVILPIVKNNEFLDFKKLGISEFDKLLDRTLFTSPETSGQYITALNTYAGEIKNAFEDAIDEWSNSDPLSVEYKTSKFLNKGKGQLDFPIFTEPTSALGLLFGQDVPIFTFDIPSLSAGLDFDTNIRIWGPLVATFGGSLGLNLDFGIGYDTRGLATLLKGADGDVSTPEDILTRTDTYDGILEVFDGFYLRDWKDGQDIDEILLSGELRAGAGLDVVIASADVFGRILATLGLDLNDVIEPDGKLRGSEIVDLIEYNPLCLFNIGGDITAGFGARVKVGWGPFSYTKRWDSPTVSLLTFEVGCEFNPNKLAQNIAVSDDPDFAPDLAYFNSENGTLLLFTGSDALNSDGSPKRNVGQNLIDEEFQVTQSGSTITVKAFGENSESFSDLITKIVANSRDGRDVIDVSAVAIPAELKGGRGTDGLKGGSQADVLEGEEDGDSLEGNGGDDTLNGGSGNDALRGGADNDTYLYDFTQVSNPGQDTITERQEEGTDDRIQVIGVSAITESDLQFADKDAVRIVRPIKNPARAASDPVPSTEDPKNLIIYFGDSKYAATDRRIVVEGQFQEDGSITPKVESITFDSGLDAVDLTKNLRFVGSDRDDRPDRMAGTTGNDRLEGRGGNDLLQGEAGDDTLDGGAGDDVLIGGAGGDKFTGGAGFDAVSYETASAVVKVDLTQSKQPEGSGDASSDEFLDTIEQIVGSDIDTNDSTDAQGNPIAVLDDEIRGYSDKRNILYGGIGDDKLIGGADDDLLIGGIGDDTLDGAEGVDSTSYDSSEPGELIADKATREIFGVTVNLADHIDESDKQVGKATGKERVKGQETPVSFEDTLINIENVEGTENGDDTISGDAKANILRGLGGYDLLSGAGDDDVLLGGTGHNTLIGGSHEDKGDTASYADYLKAPGNTEEKGVFPPTLGVTTLGNIENPDPETLVQIGVFATLQADSQMADKLLSEQHGIPLDNGQTRVGKNLAQAFGLDRLDKATQGKFGVAGGDTTDFGKLSIFVNWLGHLPTNLTGPFLQQKLFGALYELDLLKLASILPIDTAKGLVGKEGTNLRNALESALNTLKDEGLLINSPTTEATLNTDTLSFGLSEKQLSTFTDEKWQTQLLTALRELDGKIIPIADVQNLLAKTETNLRNTLSGVLTKLQSDGFLLSLPTAEAVLQTDTLSFGISENQLSTFTAEDWQTQLLLALRELNVLNPNKRVLNLDSIPVGDNNTSNLKGVAEHLIQTYQAELTKGAISRDAIRTALNNVVFDDSPNQEDPWPAEFQKLLKEDHDLKLIYTTDDVQDSNKLIENLTGSQYNDVLEGDETPNTLAGNFGNDYLIGGVGPDVLYGDLTPEDEERALEGLEEAVVETTQLDEALRKFEEQKGKRDIASYETSTQGLRIELSEPDADGLVSLINSTGDAEGDVIKEIEQINGSQYDDTIIGNSQDNILSGLGGKDILRGGGGTNTLSYRTSQAGVTVNLLDRVVSDGDADGDDIDGSFANVEGSYWDENVITGDDDPNLLVGGQKSDTIYGLSGGDSIVGDAGDDIIDAGADSDIIDAGEGNDNVLAGTGNDTIFGREGDDTIDAGDDDDWINAGLGTNTIQGGTGDDTVSYRDYVKSYSDEESKDPLPTGLVASLTANSTLTDEYGTQSLRAFAGRDTASDEDNIEDTYTPDIENIEATNYNDILEGSDKSNKLWGYFGEDVLYGLAGNDFLYGGAQKDILRGGAGDDFLEGGTYGDDISGGEGNDTITYENSSAGVTVSLVKGEGIGKGGEAEGDKLADDLENIIGSSHDDTLTGDEHSNYINGGEGSDFITGGAGPDTLDGGIDEDGKPDIDTLSYEKSQAGVTVTLPEDGESSLGEDGDAEEDEIWRFENLKGSDQAEEADALTGNSKANTIWGLAGGDTIKGMAENDRLYGGAGDDTLLGGEGDDFLQGGTGKDNLDGGVGVDTASFEDILSSAANPQAGVDVNLLVGKVTELDSGGYPYQTDTITAIENVIGSNFNDRIVGDQQSNQFWGLAGDDFFLSGKGGNDTIDGGSGTDTVDYLGASRSVTISLKEGKASDGIATDTLISIENATGSAFSDTIEGNDQVNHLTGRDGDDLLVGLGGGDILDGAEGIDTVSYESSPEAVNVNLETGQASGGHAEGDRISNAENLIGSDYGDILTGNPLANEISGLKGQDTLIGGGGSDTLLGGEDNDILYGDEFLAQVKTFLDPTPTVDEFFGISVAILGNKVLIGASGKEGGGAAFLFDLSTGKLLQKFLNPARESGSFGRSVAISDDTVLIGTGSSAYLFDILTGNLLQTFLDPRSDAQDSFGSSVAISGNKVLIGTRNAAAYLFNANTGSLLQTFLNPDPSFDDFGFPINEWFSYSVAISGDKVAIGVPLSGTGVDGFNTDKVGAAYIFDATTGQLRQKLLNPTPDSNDLFGISVAISDDEVLVGAVGDDTGGKDRGSAYSFDIATGQLLHSFSNPAPTSIKYLGQSVPIYGSGFGTSVAISGDHVLIGSEDHFNRAVFSGNAYLFDKSTGELLYSFLNPTPKYSEYFGSSIDIDNNNILIGADLHDSDTYYNNDNIGIAYLYTGSGFSSNKGDDRLDGGPGSDTLTGGAGKDCFVLALNYGTDTITDFTIGEDQIQLTGSLTFAQLDITQGTGENINDTLIRVPSNNNELLAVLKGVNADAVKASASQIFVADGTVINGSFESGNTGFSSGYPSGLQQSPPWYAIATDPHPLNSFWSSFGDHTTGSGNMMIVDGNINQPLLTVWQETVPVIPNVNYDFSSWIASAYPESPAHLTFQINGAQVGNTFTASTTPGQWQPFFAIWNSGSNTSATLSIIDQNLDFVGNDFALDDISFIPSRQTIVGTDNRDTLIGGAGNDSLIGNLGADILTGGGGRDQFIYQSIRDGRDTITDFTIGQDQLVLTPVFQGLNLSFESAIAEGYLNIGSTTTGAYFQVDPDGSAGNAFRPMTLAVLPTITGAALNNSSNFVL